MKIGLITIHYANSYGGLLQTYASQKVLSRFGSVKILDYAHPNLRNTLRAIRWGATPKDVLRVGKDLLRMGPRKRLTTKFKGFIENEFRLSEMCATEDDLRRVARQLDVVICGSDQIWNPRIIGSHDRNYFLRFAEKSRRVALSSSCGSYKYSESEMEVLREDLSAFDAIAVREPDTAQMLKQLLQREDIACTPDPTLLLSKGEWEDVCSESSQAQGEYILVYTLIKDDLVREAVGLVAKKLGRRIVVIDQDMLIGFSADQHIMDASPPEFLALFKGASFVVTNSFHGTVFALVFQKPFLTVSPHAGKNRIENLLGRVGEIDRFVSARGEIESSINDVVDVEARAEKLTLLRNEGLGFLQRALGASARGRGQAHSEL